MLHFAMAALISCTVVCLDSQTCCFFAESNTGEEGLSAYAMDTIPEDLLQQAEGSPGMGFEGTNRAWVSFNNPNPAVVDNLQGLAKVVANRHLPRVQGWLKVLVKVRISVRLGTGLCKWKGDPWFGWGEGRGEMLAIQLECWGPIVLQTCSNLQLLVLSYFTFTYYYFLFVFLVILAFFCASGRGWGGWV